MKGSLPCKVVLVLGVLVMSGGEKDPDPDPQFSSFEEELKAVNKYLIN